MKTGQAGKMGNQEEMIVYKTEIGLRQTKMIDGKEVFVDWRGKSTENQ